MSISFIRIDSRLIHTQIAARWSAEYPCDGLVAVDDSVAGNPVMVRAFKSAINKPVHILTHEQFLEMSTEIIDSDKNWFLITRDPLVLSSLLVEDELPLKHLTVFVGPQDLREGAVVVGKNQAIGREEAAALERIHEAGYRILFVLIPDVGIGDWKNLRSGFGY